MPLPAMSQPAIEMHAKLDQLLPRFRERAAEYEALTRFPAEDFADLRDAGLFGLYAPIEAGGMGLSRKPWAAWLAFKKLGSADLGLARAFEAHANMLETIDYVGSPEQRTRFFKAALEDGAIFGSWASEPMTSGGREGIQFEMEARPVEGGYLLNGVKGFCSGAGGADWALVIVGTRTATGARDVLSPTALTLIVDVRTPQVAIEPEWWQPSGMISSVSHSVRFSDAFVPSENQLGTGSYYAKFGFLLAKQLGQIGCSILGAAEAAYEFSLAYLRQRNMVNDAYVQLHIAEMELAIGTANRWAEHAAMLWENESQVDEATDASFKLRVTAEVAAQAVIHHLPMACGARSLFHQYPFERINRDLAVYIRQMSSDRLRAGIAQRALGGFATPTAVL